MAGDLWLFGGIGLAAAGPSGLLNDLWKFDGANWTWVSGSNETGDFGRHAGLNTPASDNSPAARHGVVMWQDMSRPACVNTPSNWITYLERDGVSYGANQCSHYELNEASGVCLDFGHYESREGVTANQACCVCGGGYTAAASGAITLFGGNGLTSSGQYGLLSDMWSFDGQEWAWSAGLADTAGSHIRQGRYGTESSAAVGNWPSARRGSVAWVDLNQHVWLLGGDAYPSVGSSLSEWNGVMNDAWSYANLCTSGITILHSPTRCQGFVDLETCIYTCNVSRALHVHPSHPAMPGCRME